ncbi:MAG: hypothetical protein HZB26_06375 [Candidatus Hydrogenedentes bacterium]|nr:hypothetical protein [Candidatus Hydrogenedentota bacterium]
MTLTTENQWIDEATRGLCDEARVRVRREIQDHCADIVADELQKGQSIARAHKAAVESLGSAKTARHDYRRTYLTRGDERKLKRLQNRVFEDAAVGLQFAATTFMGIAMVWHALTRILAHHPATLAYGACALFIVCLFGRSWLIPRMYQRSRRRAAVFLDTASLFGHSVSVSLLMLSLAIGPGLRPVGSWALFVAMSVSTVVCIPVALLDDVRLCRKLRGERHDQPRGVS